MNSWIKTNPPKPGDQDGWAPTFLGELPHELRSGDTCPQCGLGVLDYDGMLNLSCPLCKFALGGCFT